MMEDPEGIQLNIQHYQHLLTLQGTKHTRDQLLRLLDEAQAQLPLAGSGASDRKS